MSEAVLGRVANLVRLYLEVVSAGYTRQTRLESLGLEKSDIDDLLCFMEMEFGIDLGDVDESTIDCIGDFCTVIEPRLEGASA